MATEKDEYGDIPPERIQELREMESISPEDLRRIATEMGTTPVALLENETVRRSLVKALTRHDIETHRDIYDRLADS